MYILKMPRHGKIEDPERLEQLAAARKKSLETRRRKKKIKELKKKEEEEKLKKYEEMLAKQEAQEKKNQVNGDDPIEARVANTSTTESETDNDENVVNHPAYSRFGEKPMVEFVIEEEPEVQMKEPEPKVEEKKPVEKKPKAPVKKATVKKASKEKKK